MSLAPQEGTRSRDGSGRIEQRAWRHSSTVLDPPGTTCRPHAPAALIVAREPPGASLGREKLLPLLGVEPQPADRRGSTSWPFVLSEEHVASILRAAVLVTRSTSMNKAARLFLLVLVPNMA
jgi:hypothetical protein